MKKCIGILSGALLIFFSVGSADAHMGMMDYDQIQSGPGVMQYLEDQAVGDDALHENMEDIMLRMMSGQQLSQEETEQMLSYMQQYPGPMGMMLYRLNAAGSWYDGMHRATPWGSAGVWYWISVLAGIIWLLAGVLAVIFLLKRLQKA